MSRQGIAIIVAILAFIPTGARSGPRVAVMNFHDEKLPAGLQQTYAGITALVQVHLQETGLELVDRELIDRAVQELRLSQLLSPNANRLAQGRWARADLLVEGVWGRSKPIVTSTNRLVIPPAKSLRLQVVDLRRGIVLGAEILKFSKGVELDDLDDRFAQQVANKIVKLVSKAERIRADIDRKLVIAPVFLQTVEAKGGRIEARPELQPIREQFELAIERVSDTNRLHVLRFQGTDKARSEAELQLLGLLEGDASAWQTLADVYVWGGITTSPSNYVFQVRVWNRRGQPVALKETAANGIPREFQEWPRDASGNAYPTNSPEYLHYAEGRKPYLTFPTNEVSAALERLGGAVVSKAIEMRTDKPVEAIDRRFSGELLAPFRAVDEFWTKVHKKNGTYDPVMAALGMGRLGSRVGLDGSREMVRAAEVASFFDPGNQAVSEELMIALDHLEYGLLQLPEFDFRSSLRWGRHVDRFGLQTAEGVDTTLRSGGKIEPYFGRWFNCWINLRELQHRPVLPLKLSGTFYRPFPAGQASSWMFDPEVLNRVEREASQRLFATLDYMAQGRLAVGNWTALPRTRHYSSRMQRPHTLPFLLRAAVQPPLGLVAPELREEAERLLDEAVKAVADSVNNHGGMDAPTRSNAIRRYREAHKRFASRLAANRKKKELEMAAALKRPLGPRPADPKRGVWGGKWRNQFLVFFQIQNTGLSWSVRYRCEDYVGGFRRTETFQLRDNSAGLSAYLPARILSAEANRSVIRFQLKKDHRGYAVRLGDNPIGASLVRLDVGDIDEAREADLFRAGWRPNLHPPDRLLQMLKR